MPHAQSARPRNLFGRDPQTWRRFVILIGMARHVDEQHVPCCALPRALKA